MVEMITLLKKIICGWPMQQVCYVSILLLSKYSEVIKKIVPLDLTSYLVKREFDSPYNDISIVQKKVVYILGTFEYS
jgi:hypothetical protein